MSTGFERYQKEKENTNKYNSQGQFAISILWFDIDHEWLEENFSTSELNFYKCFYQTNIRGQEKKKYRLFVVPIGNAKITQK